jgi:hypothetical protein
MKNKKAQAGSAILWIYKFIMLIIVIGGIVAIVFLHYSKQYDVRDVEASVLAGKVIDCFSDKGKINSEDFTKENLDSCLTFDKDEIFLNVTLLNKQNSQSVSLGDSDFRVYCEAKEQEVDVKNAPSCLEKDFDLLVDNEQGKINLFIAITKFTKNA